MGAEGLDCTWCGSARSIEYGICQVCLMEYPLETQIIPLPHDRLTRVRSRTLHERVIDLTDKPTLEIAE